ncbi:hypothetical protein [Nonomuraea sp. NPDC050783]|uniref:hypothetical protein n=1 Tax=Nonomuraea sp. NPDC050783 TaxID=3154634 RepID=UPI003466FE06
MKLRVEGLEAGRGAVGADEGEVAARQAELLRELNDRTRQLQQEIAAFRCWVGEVCAEVGQDIAALQTEVEGIRWVVSAPPGAFPGGGGGPEVRLEVAESFAGVRAEMAQEFESVRSEMLDLGIKIDRLLRRRGD